MPAEHLIPGFFGKIPATGDFVTRRLSRDFVRSWDRLAARHLVPLLERDLWPDGKALRFLWNAEGRPAMAGIAVPSLDRVGRLFPLTAASPCHPAGPDTISDASDWFRQIESALVGARDRRESADRLASELAALPFKRPQRLSVGKSRKGLWLWAENSTPTEADPEDPSSVLDELLVPVGEAR